MVERTIILPTKDNNGASLTRRVNAIKLEILAIAGGYSETRQRGAWRDDDGTTYHDVSIRLVTTVDTDTDARIVERIPGWASVLRQVCIYTHATDVQATFVYPMSSELDRATA